MTYATHSTNAMSVARASKPVLHRLDILLSASVQRHGIGMLRNMVHNARPYRSKNFPATSAQSLSSNRSSSPTYKSVDFPLPLPG